MSVSDIAIQINQLLSGACAVAYTPVATAAPTNIGDIISMVGDPDIDTDWDLFGATKGGASYSMDVKSEELTVDQRTGAIFEDITEIARGLKVDIAEISPEHWKIVEQAAAIDAILAGANTSAQRGVKSGSFTEFDRYRVAFIAQRRKSQGLITEPGGATRGRYVVFGFYSASLAAVSSETKLDQGALATRTVEFKGFPDTALAAGADTMFFFDETAGTISAT